jgi:hypothetical protein
MRLGVEPHAVQMTADDLVEQRPLHLQRIVDAPF